MRQDFEKLFSHLESVEPPAGLFDRIIFVIKKEQELRHTRRLVFGFLSLLTISFIAIPFSWTMLTDQIKSSGILYFISMAANDPSISFVFWQDLSLAILESLPIMGIVVFIMNIILALFTIRLFFYRKRLLLTYLINS